MNGTILVATAGQGVIRSADDGSTWARTPLEQALEFDSVVRCIAVHPERPNVVYAGAEVGLVRSEDAGHSWTRVDGPFNDMQLWTLSIDRSDPEFILVGSGAPDRARVWSSVDGGRSWSLLPPEIPERCAGVSKPRILTSTVDPVNRDNLWFGIEEGGLWRSSDRGGSWSRIDTQAPEPDGTVTNSDVHTVMVHPGGNGIPKTHLVVTVNALWISRDEGETWRYLNSKQEFGLRYARTVTAVVDSTTLLYACGDGTPGTESKIFRSEDLGDTWTETSFDVAPGSTIWGFATHPADRELIMAGTKYGDLYRSTDAGRTWVKEWRSFPEITSLTWTPALAPVKNAH